MQLLLMLQLEMQQPMQQMPHQAMQLLMRQVPQIAVTESLMRVNNATMQTPTQMMAAATNAKYKPTSHVQPLLLFAIFNNFHHL